MYILIDSIIIFYCLYITAFLYDWFLNAFLYKRIYESKHNDYYAASCKLNNWGSSFYSGNRGVKKHVFGFFLQKQVLKISVSCIEWYIKCNEACTTLILSRKKHFQIFSFVKKQSYEFFAFWDSKHEQMLATNLVKITNQAEQTRLWR